MMTRHAQIALNLTRRGAFALGLGAASLGFAGPAFALSTSEAEAFVNGVIADLRGIIDGGDGGPEGAARFLTLLENKAAIDAVAKFAMGRNWRDMSDAQQTAYGGAFRTYISQTYQNRFSEYAGEDVVVTGSVDAGSKGVLVKSLRVSQRVQLTMANHWDRVKLSSLLANMASKSPALPCPFWRRWRINHIEAIEWILR